MSFIDLIDKRVILESESTTCNISYNNNYGIAESDKFKSCGFLANRYRFSQAKATNLLPIFADCSMIQHRIYKYSSSDH